MSSYLGNRWISLGPYGFILWSALGISFVSYGIIFLTKISPTKTPIIVFWFSITCAVLALATISTKKRFRVQFGHLIFISLFLGVFFLTLGMLYLWVTEKDPYFLAQQRFRALPIDNQLPLLFADRLATNSSTHLFIGDWNGSDRPPLLSGYVLLTNDTFSFLLTQQDSTRYLAFASQFVAQFSWIPAVFYFLKSLEFKRPAIVISIAFASVTFNVVINTVFSWPKLLSASFVLLSVGVLTFALNKRLAFELAIPIAAIFFTLAMLSHGGAAFTIPVIAILGIAVFVRFGSKKIWVSLLIGLGISAAIYSPWIYYQKIVDPPGDRLLKWYLAGVINPDPRSFWDALIDVYRSTPISEIFNNRLANLATVAETGIRQLNVAYSTGNTLPLRRAAFFYTFPALELGIISLTVCALWLLYVYFKRTATTQQKYALLIISGCFASLAFWIAVTFNPEQTTVHQGSLAWLLIFLCLPVAFISQYNKFLGLVLTSFQLLILLVVFSLPQQRLVATFNLSGAAVLSIGIIILLSTVWFTLMRRFDTAQLPALRDNSTMLSGK